MIHYEDIAIGTHQSFGRYEVSAEEVREFAEKYDPQPFHLSQEAAAKTHFGRISASGWHTCAMTMRMLVENMSVVEQAGLGSPGIDSLRWIRPVYPGDVLRCETEIVDKRRSKSKPDLGLFKSRVRTFNQDDTMVLEMVSNGLIRVRDPDAPIEDTSAG
ncbi:MaoC family dehydratase [Qipengyuania sp. MTN3-11]|uniref:MaoC family dehydratase n=1 Tax=Qipengyuania sp. MTN3-11 TaxID=3056557 RepID=UPI0036F31C99